MPISSSRIRLFGFGGGWVGFLSFPHNKKKQIGGACLECATEGMAFSFKINNAN